jgi:thiol-disulfide isomerase/thioredoxin
MRARIGCMLILIGLTASAQTGLGVKPGDAPPPITVEEWIKGEPVPSFEPGNVYLVEFWGTWCGPCIKNIPHLSRLQKEFGGQGLIVIGVASHEFKGRETLLDFMKQRGDEMAYRVAFDSDQSMERDWDTGGAKETQFRLPLSFVIDRGGRVRFVGHPDDPGMDRIITDAVAGR